MQPIGSNRVVFRQLSPVIGFSTRSRTHYAVCQPLSWRRADLSTTWLNHRVRVPNWLLALSLIATLSVSALFSVALVSQPAQSVSRVTIIPISVPAPSVPLVKSVPIIGASTVSGADSTSYARVATLQGQVQAMNSNLQSLQQESDALRNAAHTQDNDLASARTNLAGSQDSLQEQAQALNSRMATIQQDLQTRLAALDQSVASAGQAVSDVRTILGLPASPSQTAVGGQ